jgi:hypothetical protein
LPVLATGNLTRSSVVPDRESGFSFGGRGMSNESNDKPNAQWARSVKAVIYDKVIRLWGIARKPELRDEFEALRDEVQGLCCTNITELREMLRMFPKREQWAHGDLGKMKQKMMDASAEHAESPTIIPCPYCGHTYTVEFFEKPGKWRPCIHLLCMTGGEYGRNTWVWIADLCEDFDESETNDLEYWLGGYASNGPDVNDVAAQAKTDAQPHDFKSKMSFACKMRTANRVGKCKLRTGKSLGDTNWLGAIFLPNPADWFERYRAGRDRT